MYEIRQEFTASSGIPGSRRSRAKFIGGTLKTWQ
jgi:hypothetical protein